MRKSGLVKRALLSNIRMAQTFQPFPMIPKSFICRHGFAVQIAMLRQARNIIQIAIRNIARNAADN
jgi:hypothetical protein